MSLSNSNKGEFSKLTASDYREVFDEYYDAIRNFLYFKTYDEGVAEDIAQDTFVKLWENRAKIDRTTIKSYLYTIANNLAINSLKRQQLRYKFENSTSRKVESQSPEFIAEMKEYEEKVNLVISEMTEGSREVFLMNRIEGLKYKEIAERIGISVKAVEKRMSKALQVVRDRLGVNI
ncbi:RNA polymerase sigma factor [Halocola ammonii]